MCERPGLLHLGPCERKTEVGKDEYGEIWREWCLFKEKMKSIRKRQKIRRRKKKCKIIVYQEWKMSG